MAVLARDPERAFADHEVPTHRSVPRAVGAAEPKPQVIGAPAPTPGRVPETTNRGAVRIEESRRLGFVFLSGEESAAIFRQAGKFFLWEGRFIGEAVVVTE